MLLKLKKDSVFNLRFFRTWVTQKKGKTFKYVSTPLYRKSFIYH